MTANPGKVLQTQQMTSALKRMLADTDHVVVVCEDEEGRRMAWRNLLADFDHSYLEDLSLLVDTNSTEVEHVRARPRVTVQVSGESMCAYIRCVARIILDEGELADVWREQWSEQFSGTPAQGEVALLRARPYAFEAWGARAPHGIKFGAAAVKADFRAFAGRRATLGSSYASTPLHSSERSVASSANKSTGSRT